MRQFADLQETWKQSIEQWTDFVKDGSSPDSLSPKALREMFAPARWSRRGTGAFDADLQQVIEGPRYATLWDLDREVAGLHQLTMKRDKPAAAYQAVVPRTWNTVFKRLMKSFFHVAWLDRPLAGGRQRDADRGAKPDVALGLGLSVAGTRTGGSLVRCLPHAWLSPPAARRWSAEPNTGEISLDGGHVGVFVSAKSQGVLADGIADRLRQRH
jgi:hypothetical protein